MRGGAAPAEPPSAGAELFLAPQAPEF